MFLSSHTEPDVVEKTENITSYGYVVKNSGITVLDASIKMAFKLFNANSKIKSINSKLQATIDVLPDMLFELDINGKYYDFHAPRKDLLYQPAEKFMGRTVGEILPAHAADAVMAAIKDGFTNIGEHLHR